MDVKFNTVMDMFANITDMIKSRFPGTPVLPTFGNNDMIKHNSVPSN